jgi:hypothetical protein
MGGNTPATTTTTSNSQPWSEATPLLQSLISKYGAVDPSLTSGQSTALGNLQTAAGAIPNFGDTASSGVSKLFDSSTSPQVGMLQSGYDQLNKNIGGTASGAELDPYSIPGFGDALKTTMSDITNQVKGVYAGSGRDPSGAGSFAGSLGRGLTQGVAPIVQSQFNTNKQNQLNSASTLYGASGSTAGNITNQNQVPLQNILSGLQGAGMIPGLYTAPATSQLGAANAAQSQPLTNLAGLLNPALGLGALGTSSTGTSVATPANNQLMNILGGLSTGAGLLFSDERLKENVKDVGVLFDGTPVKEYNYVGDDTPQLGMIAQDIEKHNPEAGAVVEIGGFKAVNYRRATERAAQIGRRVGMLDQFKEAA